MTDLPPRSDAEFLEEMKRSTADELRYFSNKGKEERERWVVEEFLKWLGIEFAKEELRSLEPENKADVAFRDGRFQVKEITDPDIRRGDEVRTVYERVEAAKTVEDILGPGLTYDTPPLINGYELVRKEAERLTAKYTSSKGMLDLLFYVTRRGASAIQPQEVSADEFSIMGWRSISCLIGDRSIILFAGDDAPSFLRIKR